MKKLDIKTTTYSYTKVYMVDIVETEDKYEAYIYTEQNIMKQFVMACPKETLTKAEFTAIVDGSMDEYISDYEYLCRDDEDDEEWE